MSWLQEWVRGELQRWYDVRERACEAALQTGVMGVLVVEDITTMEFYAAPDPRVPYGRLYQFSSRAAADAWEGES